MKNSTLSSAMEVAPRQWNKQIFPFKKISKCGGCGGSVTAEIKYRRQKNGKINTHIYYHCNRIRDYDCKEPYITETELIKQLTTLLPEIKIDTEFMWQRFEDDIKRLNHLRGVMNQGANEIRLTPHNTQKSKTEITEEENQMLRQYLVHILQYGTPEERKNILGGIKSKFELSDRRLLLR